MNDWDGSSRRWAPSSRRHSNAGVRLMSKKEPSDKDDDVTGAAGFEKIARGLSDLFNVLADFDQLPRRGRHEKDGRVMEYSFGTRTLGEAAAEKADLGGESRRAQKRRRKERPSEARSRSSSRSRTYSTNRAKWCCSLNCLALNAKMFAVSSTAISCCSRRRRAKDFTARKRSLKKNSPRVRHISIYATAFSRFG